MVILIELMDEGEQNVYGTLHFKNNPPTSKSPPMQANDLVNMEYVSTIGLIGRMDMWPVATPPLGYLLCDGLGLGNTGSGADYEGDDYRVLYDLLQDTYGGTYDWTGGGVINLPDLRGKFPLCTSPTYAIGATGGAETVALSVSEMPSHSHNVPAYTGPAGIQIARNFGTGLAPVATTNTGGGSAHENMPPYLVVNWIIKYK